MEFPVYLYLGSWRIHPHVLFESLAYFIGFRVYLWTRRPSGMTKLMSLQILAGIIAARPLAPSCYFGWRIRLPLGNSCASSTCYGEARRLSAVFWAD